MLIKDKQAYYRSLRYFFLVLWMVFAAYGMFHHEVWRDEMRPLSIALSAHSYFDLPRVLQDEGHPLLWYALLRFLYGIFHTTMVLPVLSIAFALGMTYLLFFRSPFPLWVSIGIAFGFYCLYAYGINIRNYGMAGFFMFTAVWLFSKTNPHQLLAFVFLGLAAQSNLYASMFALLLSLYFGVLILPMRRYKIAAGGVLLVFMSFLFGYYVVRPTAASTSISHHPFVFSDLKYTLELDNGFMHYLYPLFHWPKYTFTIVVICIASLFYRNWKAIIVILAGTYMMSFFSVVIRQNFMHHQGMWFVFMVVVFWLHFGDIKKQLAPMAKMKPFLIPGLLCVIALLMNNLLLGYQYYSQDINYAKSDSENMARWLKKNTQKSDVVISDPDYIMEGVMYGHWMPWYIPREGKFGTYVSFTTQNKSQFSLNELMHAADSFIQEGKKVWLVFNHPIKVSDQHWHHGYQKVLKTDSFSNLQFLNRYQLADSVTYTFISDERYFIYKPR